VLLAEAITDGTVGSSNLCKVAWYHQSRRIVVVRYNLNWHNNFQLICVAKMFSLFVTLLHWQNFISLLFAHPSKEVSSELFMISMFLNKILNIWIKPQIKFLKVQRTKYFLHDKRKKFQPSLKTCSILCLIRQKLLLLCCSPRGSLRSGSPDLQVFQCYVIPAAFVYRT